MNSTFNSALKQSQSLRRSLDTFATTPSSAASAGAISASIASFSRTLDDYKNLARRELIPAKQEKAFERLKSFQSDLSSFQSEFETLKATQTAEVELSDHVAARSELLGRRPHASATPENPYANSTSTPRGGGSPWQAASGSNGMQQEISAEENAYRESGIFGGMNTQLDGFLERGHEVLGRLKEDRELLKGTQKRLYSVGNTLGISRDTIKMIERRAQQDKFVFWGGVTVFFVCAYFIVRWLR